MSENSSLEFIYDGGAIVSLYFVTLECDTVIFNGISGSDLRVRYQDATGAVTAIDGASVTHAILTEFDNYEPRANKQNSLATDGTGTKFPTVGAVNTGLDTKLSKASNLSDVTNRQTALDNLLATSGATDGQILSKDPVTHLAKWTDIAASGITSGITSVVHDDTLSGAGTVASPLVVNVYETQKLIMLNS